jgi:hypothetical protein
LEKWVIISLEGGVYQTCLLPLLAFGGYCHRLELLLAREVVGWRVKG